MRKAASYTIILILLTVSLLGPFLTVVEAKRADMNSPPSLQSDFAITVGAGRGNTSEMTILLGMSIQEPDRTDINGSTIDESPLGPRWLAAPRESIRFPSGTDSYTITAWNNSKMQYFFDTFMPKYPTIYNDQTWPPQLDKADLQNWVTPQTRKITLGNEPPSHTPDIFADGDAYVAYAKSIYDFYPALQDKMWIQTGKPEVVRYNATTPSGVLIHQDHLNAASTAVAMGQLPARIVTTHKIFDDYPDDRLSFYRTLIDDYKTYFGDDVQVCFQEYKYGDATNVSMEMIIGVAEFQLIMSRLRFEDGATINGGTFQQGFASGNHNYIGLNNPTDKEWVATAFTDLWDKFGQVFMEGEYVETEYSNKSERLQMEIFKVPDGYAILYSNQNSFDVALDVENATIDYANSIDYMKSGVYDNKLPARSAGLIKITTLDQLNSTSVPETEKSVSSVAVVGSIGICILIMVQRKKR